MDSTLESCNKSRAEVEEFYSRCRRIARKWHFKVGLDADDLCQDMMLTYVEWRDKVPPQYNREAYLTRAVVNSVRNHLDSWYGKGQVRLRKAVDVFEVEIAAPAYSVDVLARVRMHDEIAELPKGRRRAIEAVIHQDADADDLGISTRALNQHIAGFIEHMQERLGLDKVKRKDRRDEIYVISRNGITESGTVGELCKRLSLDNGNLTQVVRGKTPSVKGWRLA